MSCNIAINKSPAPSHSDLLRGILIMFSSAVREIEDLIHKWKAFLKVINKDCLCFINKICILVVIIRDETKKIVLNSSVAVNNIYNESIKYAVFFTPMVTLDFILHKELVSFSEIPKNNHFIHFQRFFLDSEKISLTFGLKRKFCYGIYC